MSTTGGVIGSPLTCTSARLSESTLTPWADAVKRVAAEKKVPVIDLHTLSIAYCEKLGPERTAALNFPDMESLSRSQTTVGAFTAAFVAANPGMSADMVRLDVTPLGWLKELRLCLGKDYRPVPCSRDIGGEESDTRLRIWPAR